MLSGRVKRLEEAFLLQEKRIQKLESENRMIRAAIAAMVQDSIGSRGMSLMAGPGGAPGGRGGGMVDSLRRYQETIPEGTDESESDMTDLGELARSLALGETGRTRYDSDESCSSASGSASSNAEVPSEERENLMPCDQQVAPSGEEAKKQYSAQQYAANATYCAVCDQYFNSPKQYDAHLPGRKHKAKVAEGEAQAAEGDAYVSPSSPDAIASELRRLVNWPVSSCGGRHGPGMPGLDLDRAIDAQAYGRAYPIDGLPVDASDGVLLYYKYVPLEDPEAIRAWQFELCKLLSLTGRIRIAGEGINGTVGGDPLALQLYMHSVLLHPDLSFTPKDFKTGLMAGGAQSFPNLWIKVCREIVVLGVNPDALPPHPPGNHLTPQQFHAKLEAAQRNENDEGLVLLDCRNFYESRIGCFMVENPVHASSNAVPLVAPATRQFSDFPAHVDKLIASGELKKDAPVLMYCTGGIRCERGSALLREKGIRNVYQLEGGIHKYVQAYPDGGFYKGKLFVFDRRVALHAGSDEVVGQCDFCQSSFDEYDASHRCASCRVLVLACPTCRTSVPREQMLCFACEDKM